MLPTALTELALRLSVLFLPLLSGIPARSIGRRTDALLLSYNFNITSSARPRQPWCEIEAQGNGNEFLYYDCQSKKVKPIGPLGMKLNETAFWGTQKEPLEDLVQEFRKKLLDIKAEIFTESNSVTMQGTLMCERGTHGHTRGSLQFGFNGQMTYLFDLENRKWTMDHSGDQQVKGMLDSDRELTELLVRIAHGDCRSWLQQVQGPWDEWRQSTGAPATTLAAPLVRDAAISHITSILPVLLTGSVLLVIQGTVLE